MKSFFGCVCVCGLHWSGTDDCHPALVSCVCVCVCVCVNMHVCACIHVSMCANLHVFQIIVTEVSDNSFPRTINDPASRNHPL